MPRKTPDHVITKIQNLWADKDDPKAKDVLAAYELNFWRKDPGKWSRVGLRRVQEIISARRLGGDGELIPTFGRREWKPWCPKTDPETNAFLLSMNSVCKAVEYRFIYDHEAAWGRRLRVALNGLAPYDQFCFVTLYAIREVRAHYAGAEPFTADLDEILAYKPWLPESAHAYGMAIWAGLALNPAAGSRQDLSLEDAVKSKTWETLRVDLRPPWFIIPGGVQPGTFLEYFVRHGMSLQELAGHMKDMPLTDLQRDEHMARDTALQFWMGDNPIFEKPLLHGLFGLLESGIPDMEIPGE